MYQHIRNIIHAHVVGGTPRALGPALLSVTSRGLRTWRSRARQGAADAARLARAAALVAPRRLALRSWRLASRAVRPLRRAACRWRARHVAAALGAWLGLARQREVDELRGRIDRLEQQLRQNGELR